MNRVEYRAIHKDGLILIQDRFNADRWLTFDELAVSQAKDLHATLTKALFEASDVRGD